MAVTKALKKSISVFYVILIIVLLPVSFSAAAEEKEQPRNIYYSNAQTTITISSTGNCTVKVKYKIYPNSGFTDAEIHTYVERLTFGVIWVKVNNGQPNNEWVATPTTTDYDNDYTLQLTQTGTYRAVAEFTFNGSHGSEPVYKSASTIY